MYYYNINTKEYDQITINDNRWLEYPDFKPYKYGRYEVYRHKCNKQNYLTWNGTGWSSDNNAITHFRKIINPFGLQIP